MLKGRKVYTMPVSDLTIGEAKALKGQVVEIDGQEYTVLDVETFCLPLYCQAQAIGLMV